MPASADVLSSFLPAVLVALVALALTSPEFFRLVAMLASHLSRLGWPARTPRAETSDESDAETEPDDALAALQIAARTREPERPAPPHTFPGLANSANECFLCAALQALASVEALVPYLRAIERLAAAQRASAPVASALLALVVELNAPSTSRRVLSTRALAVALYDSSESRRRIVGGDQQDAHELFVLLCEAVDDECARLARAQAERASVGLSALASPSPVPEAERPRSPFDALMARRVSCVSCRHTANIVHYSEQHLTLHVPSARACSLADLLDDSVKLDLVDERVCAKCSIVATAGRLEGELAKCEPDSVAAKKRRKALAPLQRALADGDFDLAVEALDRAERPATKQTMLSRPPAALALHLVRSSMYAGGASKNACRIAAPPELDLTPYTTAGAPSVRPEASMGGATFATGQHRYRLVSVVEHFGAHSYGHYVAYVLRAGDWWRISDDTVRHAQLADVLCANPSLLFYERLAAPAPAVRPARIVSRAALHRSPSATPSLSASRGECHGTGSIADT